MKIDKLTIRGFKSIRELENFELKKINILVGGNGAGKSNFIAFFRLLRALFEGNLNAFVQNSGGVGDLLFNGRKTTQQLEFEVLFGERGYRFNINAVVPENFSLSESRYYEREKNGWWPLGQSFNGESLLVKEAKSNTRDSQYSKPVYETISSWKIYHFHDTSDSAPMRHSEIIQDNKYLRFDAANIAPFLLRLRNEQKAVYREILVACQNVIPWLDDFILDVEIMGPKKKVALSWKKKGSDYPMQPYHLSDGSLRFICLTTALLQPNPPATMVIDEPELGLHPAAITVLAELIQSASEHSQLVVATQSPALIDHFATPDIVVVNQQNGGSSFARLKEEDFKVWLEDYSLGELWSKNVIDGGPVYE